MKRISSLFHMAAVVLTAAIVGCSENNDNSQQYNPLIDNPKEPAEKPVDPESPSGYDEKYRPQIHYTPAKNWVNDPNGLVYADGVYHLFYQYNPKGNDWGNMSWGHATSKDLMNWEEQPVALTRDELGDIFSGSCVIDKNNTAGFGANAMVAAYTSADGKQQQSIAYSTDGGKTFTRFANNPVIPNNDDNLRDPKVFWHEGSQQWIMALAKGWKKGVDFYGSKNLTNWTFLSNFFVDMSSSGRHDLQWECPDLIQLGDKWVLLLSVNPGGPWIGDGLMYFVGQFDGIKFTADALDYPLWLDYGMDNYAAVTWSNTGDRRIMIGWMNNWSYSGNVPCSPWRSAFTLPRELGITMYDGKPLVTSTVVKEIDNIAGEWKEVNGAIDAKDAYQLRVTVNLDKNSTITLKNDMGEYYTVDVKASVREIFAHRNAHTGKVDFNGNFSLSSMRAPLKVTGDKVVLDFFVDQSSVEIFTQQGTMAMTNLVFPSSIYNSVEVEGADFKCEARSLKSIWRK